MTVNEQEEILAYLENLVDKCPLGEWDEGYNCAIWEVMNFIEKWKNV